jgi:hypothetical protein
MNPNRMDPGVAQINFRLATADEKDENPKIYGFIENVYFGPRGGDKKMMYMASDVSGSNLNRIHLDATYHFSNKNINEITKKTKKKKWFWENNEIEPRNYTELKYGTSPTNGYQPYEKIPIFDSDNYSNISLSDSANKVVFLSPDQDTPAGTLFQVAWFDAIKTKMEQTKPFTQQMLRELKRDYKAWLRAGSRMDTQHTLDLSQKVDPSGNLIRNMLRDSLYKNQPSGVITQLGGGKHRSKSVGRKKQSRNKHRRTRKN